MGVGRQRITWAHHLKVGADTPMTHAEPQQNSTDSIANQSTHCCLVRLCFTMALLA
jgi:hypothetical protein